MKPGMGKANTANRAGVLRPQDGHSRDGSFIDPVRIGPAFIGPAFIGPKPFLPEMIPSSSADDTVVRRYPRPVGEAHARR
jgi:hypothetical protein